MSTTITVPFEPLGVEAGFREGSNDNGPWAVVPYLVAWNDRFQFANDMRGLSSTTGSTAPWTVRLPFQYPPAPQMYARDLTIEGCGAIIPDGGAVVQYTQALITVNFGIPPLNYQASDDPLFLNSLSSDAVENESLQFATQEIDNGAEWINVPNAPATFASDGAKVDQPLAKRILVSRLLITWHRYPLLPTAAIAAYADCVNDATFLGKDRGTVMFGGIKTVREAAANGTITQKVQMNLKWRKVDWNDFIRPDDGTFDSVIYHGDSTKLTYTYKDFGALLKFFKVS